MKKILLSALGLLALAVVPVSSYAQMPGQPCTGVTVGTTRMADDKQSIIGCLLTSEGKQVWKSTIGGASGDWQCSNGESISCVRPSDGTVCIWLMGWQCAIRGKGTASPMNFPPD